MNDQLSIERIRSALARMEETIIFGLIERAQFARNAVVYAPDGVGPLGGDSLLLFLLRECEVAHAKVRRYTSPDEHPFTDGLPAPILPVMRIPSPLHAAAAAINVNARVLGVYTEAIVPRICEGGDDGQWGSSAVNDVALLQALSRRVHYGKYVAEAKWREGQAVLRERVQAGDAPGVLDAITDAAVEARVLDRVRLKAETYGRELGGDRTAYRVEPDAVREIYERWIMPLNKDVQVAYLLARPAA